MPTKHNPPRPSAGELTKRGKPARLIEKLGRQKRIDPKRLEVVAEMMGGIDYFVLQTVLSERWKVSTRTIRSYYRMVIERMREHSQEFGFLKPDLEKSLGVHRLEALRLNAMANGDRMVAFRCIVTRMKIAGVFEEQTRHVVSFSNPLPVLDLKSLTDQELETYETINRKLIPKSTEAAEDPIEPH